jgi:DNA-binding NarL/FixJ family response regulator
MSRKPLPRRRAAKRVQIILVDDHPLVRERLAEIINREADLHVCGEAEDRHEAIVLIADKRPDLAIVDLSLKDSDGLELIKDIRARWPKVRMLVVSMHDESLYAERVIRAGALGYITKQEATRKILLAVRRVLAGTIYLNERVAAHIIGRLQARSGSVVAAAASARTKSPPASTSPSRPSKPTAPASRRSSSSRTPARCSSGRLPGPTNADRAGGSAGVTL